MKQEPREFHPVSRLLWTLSFTSDSKIPKWPVKVRARARARAHSPFTRNARNRLRTRIDFRQPARARLRRRIGSSDYVDQIGKLQLPLHSNRDTRPRYVDTHGLCVH